MRVTQDSAIPTGVANVYDSEGKQRFNPDGTPMQENTFTVYDHSAMVAMTQDLKDKFPGKFDNVSVGQSLPVRVLAKFARENTEQKSAEQAISGHLEGYNKANTDAKATTFSLSDAVRKYPIIKTIYGQIAKYGTDPLDLMFKDLRADKTVAPEALGALQSAMGITPEGLEAMKTTREAAQKAADKGDEASPAPAGLVGSFRSDIKTALPDLTDGQVSMLTKSLGATPTKKEYQAIQKEAQDLSEKNIARNAAQATKDDAAIAKGQKPVVGIDASGKQVLVPSGDVSKYGLSQVREVGQAENEKVTNARSLMTVFSNDDKDDEGLIQLATKLKDEGKLGPVASRLQDWLNRGGSTLTFNAAGDPDVQRLFTKLGLATTGLMQVHVGARGSAQMLEHFEDLAKAKSMSADAFLAALDVENKYIHMKAMLPNATAVRTPSNRPAPTGKGANTKPTGSFDPTTLPKAN